MAVYRQFGIIDDIAGGTDYDTLAAAASPAAPHVPDPDHFWPVTGGHMDYGLTPIDRNNEARGRRAGTAPIPFQSAPIMTVPVPAYPSIVTKAVAKTLSSTDSHAGSAGAGYTHQFVSQQNPTSLNAINCQLVRDALNIRMLGAYFNQLTLDFPIGGEGTMEAVLWGKWVEVLDSGSVAPPSVTFSDVSANPFVLRDAVVHYTTGGTSSLMSDLQGFNLVYNNNLVSKFFAGRNRTSMTFDDGTGGAEVIQTKRLWFPTEHRLTSMADISFSLDFGDPEVARELAMQFMKVDSFVFHIEGDPIAGSTGPVTEYMEITIYAGVENGGGHADLVARGDVTASFQGGAFWSEVSSGDILFKFLNGTSGAIS